MKFYAVLYTGKGKKKVEVIKVFTEEEPARELLGILAEHGDLDKIFSLHEVDSKAA